MTAYTEFEKIRALVPEGDDIDWNALESTVLRTVFDRMRKTEQNPEFHAEGNVYIHTQLVCAALVKSREYKLLTREEKEILFIAALLHDIGKIRATKIVDGSITSPYHSSIGAVMARELLWRELGLCGSEKKQSIRESICALIRYHSYPPFAMQDKDAERKITRIASQGELANGFNLFALYLLERADAIGRIGKDASDYISRIEYFAMMAEELGCRKAPFRFAAPYSKWAYLRKKTDWRDNNLFSDRWGEVILLSGLPGTGKDTWIKNNYPDMPVISLDDIRARLGILPTENQGMVIAEAHKMAKEYLRAKKPFIWNATCITAELRGKQISLFEAYGASVRCIFLETEWEEELRRNKERTAFVPPSVIEKMLSRLEIPEAWECERVEWLVI